MSKNTPPPAPAPAKDTERSPDFAPSMLHNRRGPLQPTTTVISGRFSELLHDRRVLAFLCVVLPPMAVFLQTGLNRKVGLSLILYAFFFLPGILYAFYVIFLERAVNPPDSTFNV